MALHFSRTSSLTQHNVLDVHTEYWSPRCTCAGKAHTWTSMDFLSTGKLSVRGVNSSIADNDVKSCVKLKRANGATALYSSSHPMRNAVTLGSIDLVSQVASGSIGRLGQYRSETARIVMVIRCDSWWIVPGFRRPKLKSHPDDPF